MEAVRPAVDAYLLDPLARRTFSLKDFHETSTGQCRLLPRLAHEVVQTAPIWAEHVAPHAEMIARKLAEDARLSHPPTLLTGAARRQARPASNHTRAPTPAQPVIRTAACAECGAIIPRDQKRCAKCHATVNADRLGAQRATETTRRRAAGHHPSQEQVVRDRIAQSQRAQWAARKATDTPSGFTGQPSEFRRLILPRLAGLAPREMAVQTGLSPGYCAQVRDGDGVPHVRHWAAFQLAGLNATQTGAASQ